MVEQTKVKREVVMTEAEWLQCQGTSTNDGVPANKAGIGTAKVWQTQAAFIRVCLPRR